VTAKNTAGVNAPILSGNANRRPFTGVSGAAGIRPGVYAGLVGGPISLSCHHVSAAFTRLLAVTPRIRRSGVNAADKGRATLSRYLPHRNPA